MQIDRANDADTPAIEALLRDAGLPLDGALEALETLGVVGREDRRVVAAAAVERYGDAGLLRSVVVAADRRGDGLGHGIVAAAEDLARDDGVRELFLVTESAVDWFPRLGYEIVDRAAAEASVGESVELTTVCKDTGVAMRRRLV